MKDLLLRWPGIDGWVLMLLSVAMLSVWLGRGQLGGGERLAVVLAVNALWLGARWWTSRRPSA